MAAGITSNEVLAEKAGVSVQVIRKWRRSKEPDMTATELLTLAETLSVRAFWLGTGRGPIHSFMAMEYTEDDLLRMFRILNMRQRALVRDFVGLVAKHRDDRPER